MSAGSTEPRLLRGANLVPAPWQNHSDVTWSFGSRAADLVSPVTVDSYPDPEAPLAQTVQLDTVGPQRPSIPVAGPVDVPDRRLGKRAWHALAEWEGVVEAIEGDTLRVRLTPLVHGKPDFTRSDFAEFTFDELAYPSDKELVQPNARLYWTVGRRRDEAGTVSNQSLVRVRRQVPISAVRRNRAAEEVAQLLLEVEGEA